MAGISIPNGSLIYLDVNVFIYAAEAPMLSHHSSGCWRGWAVAGILVVFLTDLA